MQFAKNTCNITSFKPQIWPNIENAFEIFSFVCVCVLMESDLKHFHFHFHTDIIVSCSHFRAVEYYAESILNPNAFVAVPCPINDILAQRYCASKSKAIQPVVMGEYISRE